MVRLPLSLRIQYEMIFFNEIHESEKPTLIGDKLCLHSVMHCVRKKYIPKM